MTILIRCDLCRTESPPRIDGPDDLTPRDWIEMPNETHVCGECAGHIDSTINNPGGLYDFRAPRGGVTYPPASQTAPTPEHTP